MSRHAGRVWRLAAACAVLLACDPESANDAGVEPGTGEPSEDAAVDASRAQDAATRDARAPDPEHDAASGAAGDGADSGAAADAGSDAGSVSADAGSTDAGDLDAGPTRVTVAGRVLDAWTDAEVDAALVSAEGTDPLVSDTSNGSGEYALELIAGEAFSPLVTRASHRPTRNPALEAAESDVHDVHVVANSDASRQYASLGLTATAGTAIVIATLRDADGDALEGIPLTDVTLVDGDGFPVGLGPYCFGAAGDLVDAATLTVSTAYGGRARVGFLDCPPGEHELEVSIGGGSLLAPVSCSADGATLVVPQE